MIPIAAISVAPQKNRQYNNQFDVKVDYKMTEKDNLSARWIQSDSGMTSTPVLLVSFPTAPITPVKSVAIGQITSVRSGPRKLQLDLKYIF